MTAKPHPATVKGMNYNLYHNREYKKYYNSKGKFKRQYQYFEKKYGDEIDFKQFEQYEDIHEKIEHIKEAVETLKNEKYLKKLNIS